MLHAQTRPVHTSPLAMSLKAGGIVFMLLVIWTGNALAIAAIPLAALIGWVVARMGPVGLLYLFAGLIWLLPRINLPGIGSFAPLHVVLICGLAVFWAIHYVTTRDQQRGPALPPHWPLVLVYGAGGFAAYFTGMPDVDPVNGIRHLIEGCVVVPLLYLLVWRYMRAPEQTERFMLLLSVGFVALGVIAYAFQGTPFWSPIPFEKEGLRLSGEYRFGPIYLIVSPVMMSTELSMLIPALVALAVTSNSRRRRLVAGVCLVPLTLFILLAAGRAGWIGACAGVALVLFYAVRAGKVAPGRLALVALVGLFLGTLALASLGLVNDEIARRLGSLGALAQDDTVVFRYGVWSIGLDLIQQYPLGIGFQAFRGLTGYTAHNQYILWALGTGVAGLAAVVVMLATWLSRMFVTVGRRHEQTLAVSLASFGAVVGGLLSINGDNISSSTGWTQNTLWIFLATGAAAYTGARLANPASLLSNRVPGHARHS